LSAEPPDRLIVAIRRQARAPILVCQHSPQPDEPGQSDLVVGNVAGTAVVLDGIEDAGCEADAVFIAVGTPSRRDDGHASLSLVRAERTH
jgi:UDP-glucose 6-dehydrogenase